MNDQDIIRKAVELADWWELFSLESGQICYRDALGFPWRFDREHKPMILDALAAQLVRQVDALSNIHCAVLYRCVQMWTGEHEIVTIEGPDRTMNTLRAIVESKVLE